MVTLDSFFQTLSTVVPRPARTIQQIEELLTHFDTRVRVRLAEYPYLPLELLSVLAGDSSPEVRIGVTDNPSTPLSIREMLAQDDQSDVRYAIAENANTPTCLLESLLSDENPYVASRALETLERIGSTSTLIKFTLNYCA